MKDADDGTMTASGLFDGSTAPVVVGVVVLAKQEECFPVVLKQAASKESLQKPQTPVVFSAELEVVPSHQEQ